tara:strand:- start:147 stop:986 length:840 start_codon:yes stop_codon:yes gene_type:complete
MTDLGGLQYMPGEAWSITWTASPSVADSDTVKLVFGGLSITGTVASGGGSVAFAYTATQTATLAAYFKFDAKITVNETARTESYDFTTGASVTGTASYPSVSDPLSVSAGTGIAVSPDPILTSGTVSLSAVLNDLNGVTISSGAAAGDRLEFSGSVWADTTPDPIIPRPGSAYRIVVGKVWNPLLATPALVDVYRESFFLAAGGSNPTGDIVVKASGVSFVVSAAGYAEASSVRYGMFNDNVRRQLGFSVSSGALTLLRGVDVDNADSGYFCCCDYVEA